MADTDIEWAHKVWNFTRGCRRVSPGCGGAQGQGGCYAEKTAYRFSGPGQPYEGLVTLGKHGPRWTGKGRFVSEKLDEPLRWRAPRDGSRLRIFVNSMSDLFFEEFTNEEIAASFGVMAACPQHDFLILTKRPERAAEWFKWVVERCADHKGCERDTLHHSLYPYLPDDGRDHRGPRWQTTFFEQYDVHAAGPGDAGARWPLPNVWMGVSCEDQKTADERIPLLLSLPAAVRFISAEPLLGPLDLRDYFCPHAMAFGGCWKSGARRCGQGCSCACHEARPDWIIAGSESGHHARPMDEAWVRAIRDQCQAAGVSFFYKQKLEGRKVVSLPILDGREWAEFPR